MPYYGDDLSALVGEEVNTVAFVMNYVEFHFNGPVLRALTPPAVEVGGTRKQFPEPGSRDALCALIGATVERVEVRDGECIELRTRAGHVLTIPLDWLDHGGEGREAVHFVPVDERGRLRVEAMMIW